MRKTMGRLETSLKTFSICLLLAGILGGLAPSVRAGEIESLLQRGLPTTLDPANSAGVARSGRLSPLRPLVRLPVYGLPYDLVDTTTGRLAFKIDDLVLPGRLPIVISRIFDSGLEEDFPPPPEGGGLRYWADFGPHWMVSYSDYLQEVDGGLVLAKTDAGPIKYVAADEFETTFVKEHDFPSNHLTLHVVQGTNSTTIDESRADGSVWRFVKVPAQPYYFLSSITDVHGNTVTVLHHESGRIEKILNSSGSWVEFSWEPNGQIAGIADSTGRYFWYAYSSAGRLKNWTDLGGNTWAAHYADHAQLRDITDPAGREILTVDYDSRGRVNSYATGEGTSTIDYPEFLCAIILGDPGTFCPTPTIITDPTGNDWIYYSHDGLTTEVVDPAGGDSRIEYDEHQNIISFGAYHSDKWTFTYDENHKPLLVTAPGAETSWQYEYDSATGHLVTVTNPRGYTTRFIRNTAGDVLSEHQDFDGDASVDTDEPVWNASYASNGDLLSVTNPRGNVTSFTHDAFGQLETVTLPCAQTPCPTVQLDFNNRGNIEAIHRPKSAIQFATWLYGYDARGLLTSATDPTGFIRSFEYDNAGLMTAITDPQKGTQTIEYTSSYRPSHLTDTLGAETALTYDDRGNLTVRQDALGNETTFEYDAANRLASRTDPLGRSWSYAYDTEGNLTGITHPNGQEVQMTYDARGRLLTREYPDGLTETYTYDENGNLTSVERTGISALADLTSLVYNERDLPASITTVFPPSQGVTRTEGVSFAYDVNGNRTETRSIAAPAKFVNYTYDVLDRPDSIAYHPAASSEVYSYSYDPWTLRRTSFPTRGHGSALTYDSYDDAGRITQFTVNQGGTRDGTYHVAYDDHARVSSAWKTGETQPATPNSYDAVGRLLHQLLPNGTQWDFQYDLLGRVVVRDSVREDGTGEIHDRMGYDAAGDLVLAGAGSGRVRYLYDYNPPDAGVMLRIRRDRHSLNPDTRDIEVGYDGKIARELTVDFLGNQTLDRAYRWYPFATAQLERLSTRTETGSIADQILVDALGGPALGGVASEGTALSFYDQAGVIDQERRSPFFRAQPVRGLSDREHFGLFARRGGLDPNVAGNAVAISFMGARAGAFSEIQDLVGTLSRRDEVAPHLISLGALDELPSPGYFDTDARSLLVPGNLGISMGLGAANSGREDSDLGSNPDGVHDSIGIGIANRVDHFGRATGTVSPMDRIPGPNGDVIRCTAYRLNDYCGPRTRPVTPVFGDGPEGSEPPPVLPTGPIGTPIGGGGIGLGPEPGEEPYGNASGDPYGVEVSTGEYILAVTDLEIPWPGIPFRFTRTYRSNDHAVRNPSMGDGWINNYMEHVIISSDQSTVAWYRSDHWGGLFLRHPGVANLYDGPKGSHLKLRLEGSSTIIRLPDGETHTFEADGNLKEVSDRFNNKLLFKHDLVDYHAFPNSPNTPVMRLVSVRPAPVPDPGITSGALSEVVFSYANGRLSQLMECSPSTIQGTGTCQGTPLRTITYTLAAPIENCGHTLSAVTSPAVLAAETANNTASLGKKTGYVYDCSPLAADHLHGKLIGIFDAKTNAGPSAQAQAFQTITYFEHSTTSIGSDRVRYIEYNADGTANLVGYAYDSSCPPSLSTCAARTVVTDRMGAETEYAFDGQRRLLQRTVRPDATHSIDDTYWYGTDDQILMSRTGRLITLGTGAMAGSHLETFNYDLMGNMIEKSVKADGVRQAGDDLVTRYTYDPLFNQLRTTTDPRAFTNSEISECDNGVPVSHACPYGTEAPLCPTEPDLTNDCVKRYTTTRYFDYQEGDGTAARSYAEQWALTDALNNSSIAFGLGDINGDGSLNAISGGVLRETHELWSTAGPVYPGLTLPARDLLETQYRLNARGQPLRSETLMGEGSTPSRVTAYLYGPMNDSRETERGQLVKKAILMGGAADIETTYTHDAHGNVKTEKDWQQTETRYDVNPLNQIYRTTRAYGIEDLQVETNSIYDANNKVIKARTESTPVGGSASFVAVDYEYDSLDRKTKETISVGGDARITQFRYDKEGRLKGSILPVGNTVAYGYDNLGRQTKVKRFAARDANGTNLDVTSSAEGALTITEYDGDGHIVKVSDDLGLVSRSIYDAFGRNIESLRDVDGNRPTEFIREKTTYNEAGLATVIEKLGWAGGSSTQESVLSRTLITYDEMGRAIKSCSILNPDGPDIGALTTTEVCTYTWYNRAGQPTFTRDPNGNVTSFEYDRAGRLVKKTDALGNSVSTSYDPNGNVIQVISDELDADGITLISYKTINTYDKLNRLTSTTVDPDGLHLQTQFQYDRRGNQVVIIDPEGHRTEKIYNQANQLVESRLCVLGTTDCSNDTTDCSTVPQAPEFEERICYAYDVNGLVYKQTDGNGKTTEFWYDELDRKVATKYPDNTGIKWVLNKRGNPTEIRRQEKLLRGDAGPYNPNQHFAPSTPPTIDSLIACCAGDSQCTGVNTVKRSNVCLTEDISYDTLDRVASKTFSSAGPGTNPTPEYGGTSTQSWKYDGLSRVVETSDNNGDGTGDDVVITRSYDTFSRVRGEVQKLGNDPANVTSVESGYDLNGNRLSLKYPSTFVAAFDADALNRVSSVTAGANVASYSYKGPSLIGSRTYGNGVVLDMNEDGSAYDKAKRIRHVQVKAPDDTSILNLKYGYDADSLRLYELQLEDDHDCESDATNGCHGQRYDYTSASGTRAAHRLEQFRDGRLHGDGTVISTTQTNIQTYDVEGNWKHLDVSGQGDWDGTNRQIASGLGLGMNQYADFKGHAWTYTFTGALRSAPVTSAQGTTVTWNYRYDRLDRLIEVTKNGSITAQYLYDADNRRMMKRVYSFYPSTYSDTRYAYDGWRVLEEGGTPSAPSLRFFWANGVDKLLAFEKRNQAGTYDRYFVHGDALGSVRAITNSVSAPSVKASFLYGSFGEELPVAGTWDAVAAAIPYRYTGQRFDPESGLYYYKNRYYMPQAGRFMTRDPAGYVDGANIYAYARNAASSYSDPLGLSRFHGYNPADDAALDRQETNWGAVEARANQETKEAADKKAQRESASQAKAKAKDTPSTDMGTPPSDGDVKSGKGATENPNKNNWLGFMQGIGPGMARGVKGAARGLVDAIAHPVQTTIAIRNAIQDPESTADAVSNAASRVAAADATTKGEMTGQVLAGVGLAVAAAQIGQAVNIGRAAEVGGAADLTAAADSVSGVSVGTQVFRYFGDDAKAFGHPAGGSFTTVNPGNVANFREAAGLYEGNTGRFVMEATITDTRGISVTVAAPGPGGIGGGIPEIVIPNASTKVKVTRVSGVNPPL